VVVPKDRNYIVIPTSGNNITEEIKNLDKNSAFIAPWNYCQENKEDWKHADSFETLENTACK
jgi:hypothetical protein